MTIAPTLPVARNPLACDAIPTQSRPRLLGLRLRGAWAWWRWGCPVGRLLMVGDWPRLDALLDESERRAA